MSEQDSNEESIEDQANSTRYKVIFVGDLGVGKTAIINALMDKPFKEDYENTIGVDLIKKTIKFKNELIKIQIWDTAGQEKYQGLIKSYVKNSAIVFVIYDITSKESFNNVMKWVNFVRDIEKTNFVVCGNKIDLESREVTEEDGKKLAEENKFTFYEISAKTGQGVKNMFYKAISDLPVFADDRGKEELIKELIEQNSNPIENEENKLGEGENGKEININGETKKVEGDAENKKKKKGKCKC